MPRVTITVPDQNPQPYRFQLDRGIVRLGRGSENDIAIESGSVSTTHAEMRRVPGGYELQDMGSTNGLKFHGTRCEVVPLVHGGTVFLGDVAFDFSLTDEEQEMLSRELPLQAELPVIPLPDVPVSTQPLGQAVVRPRAVPKRNVVRVPQEEGSGLGMSLVLIIFAVAAFGAGAAIRHEKETGSSLLDGIRAKLSGEKKKDAAKDPATEDAAPEADPAPAAPAAPPAPPAPQAPPAPPIVAPPVPAPAGDNVLPPPN